MHIWALFLDEVFDINICSNDWHVVDTVYGQLLNRPMHSYCSCQVTLIATACMIAKTSNHPLICLLLINAAVPVIMYHLLGALIISLSIRTGKCNSGSCNC